MAKTATRSRKEKKQSKSGAVRGYLKAHPGAKNAEVVEALKAMGVTITPNYISIIRSHDKKSGKSGMGRGTRGVRNGHVGLDQIHAAAVLIKACQGVEGAKRAISEAERLVAAMR